ncbi:K Homology domain [Macleaya cordata]|uniref:K Homology domain n=1 Tax=Macleaya cordata TaxID=56857 RepID=A0A200QCL9_MACCD|nr:K Homology domain [Macleaya cordata]
MERSRSKRNYYYDQDYDSQNLSRNKRYHHNNHHFNNNNNNNHHRRGGGGGRLSKNQDPSIATTSYRILCHDIKAGGVIGKSGSIIKAIRQETGAWINVHPLLAGDEERIIEISEARRRDPDGRVPSFSPAQEALLMIHERIIESDNGLGFQFDAGSDDGEDFGPRGGGGRIATRLVVARPNVGSLLGKGGKIIEQMRIDTKTQIRILPRDHTLPSCVSMSEEIVQVVGDANNVKKALTIISSRLRESQLRDRSNFHGRLPDQSFFPDDDFAPQMNNMSRRLSMDGPPLGPRFSSGLNNVRSNAHLSRPSGYTFESGASPMDDHVQSFSGEDLVFQICCPSDKVDRVMGENGLIEMLRGEIGVDVRATEPVPGSDERIIVISSDEGPDDELFPAQEALLHIQSQIVDLVPDTDNIITTRLLVPSSEISCLEGKDGSLSEMEKLTGTNIKILPREDLPASALGTDELVQIVGEIKAARDAIVEITSRLRSKLYRDISFPKDLPPPSISAPVYSGSVSVLEVASPNRNTTREGFQLSDAPGAGHQTVQTAPTAWPAKDTVASAGGSVDRKENDAHEEAPSSLNRLSVPLVTRSTLEVVIPEYAISKLIMRSGNKLAQISELSGASVKLAEDTPETEKVIQISGTPEQAERAQSLLQGFILSTQEDAPSS